MGATIKGTLREPLDAQKVEEITKLVLVAEARLIKAIDFDFNFLLPYNYLSHFSEAFYPDTPSVGNFALAMLNDSIGSKAPLIYHSRTLAIAAILLTANYMNI